MDFKNLAWNNFCKTGDIQSFLEYRKLDNFIPQEYNNTQQIMQNLEVMINEIDKGEGNSNKRSTI